MLLVLGINPYSRHRRKHLDNTLMVYIHCNMQWSPSIFISNATIDSR